jgi:nickel-dependent lactate racemase
LTIGKESSAVYLSEEKVKEIIAAGTSASLYEKKRVLVLTPDGTRTCPLPMMVRAVREGIGERAAQLDFMVALGTYPPLSEEKILELYGITPQGRKEKLGRSDFFCHRWDLPETFLRIGHLSEDEVKKIPVDS